jgi:TatA/E family protein of Tat protein translocase
VFGISETELALILIFAFLIFGPDKLPGMGRTVGRAIRQFRDAQDSVTKVVQSEIVDPINSGMNEPAAKKRAEQAKAAQAEDADIEGAEGAEAAAPAKKPETFAERKARLEAERKAKESAAADEKKQAAFDENEKDEVGESFAGADSDEDLPALKEKERKWVIPTVAALVILFFLGMIFCYFVIEKAAFGWLIQQTNDFASAIYNAEDYLDIFMKLEIGFGIAFEIPLVIFYLSILHIVPYATFRAQWRYIYVGLMTLSGIVTPDASPVTMLLMFAALIGLYEIALAIARQVITARDGKEALKWTREDYEEHEFDKE